MLQTKSSRLCADGGGSFIPLLEARRDSCAHGTRIANVSTSFAAICGFVPSRLLCRRGNTQIALLRVTVEGQLACLLLGKFLEPLQCNDFPERNVNGLTSRSE